MIGQQLVLVGARVQVVDMTAAVWLSTCTQENVNPNQQATIN